ncbi:hypothetical protein P152DRAFT_455750 [Eremomyces bilateralis CBS 781.70]|uniref:Integral membrane protein n=1 Tax=Eremomyces bilateralis CBS 781.70 TaxID=1392243 RepID=A0A6G1G9N9_9PEZI|nr:uncharacterized protein P152DRAFT_455750 [Eremomyces bilateralis CBS 781.70]KAF1814712.1 hypothetical protein P152DRAFT_455750 [Eremomyces bilateralis CBS 781.70]
MARKYPRLNFAVILCCIAVLLSLCTIVDAASATSFCKCTCFSNSTIIALDGSKPSTTARSGPLSLARDPKKGSGTCSSCNKKFCLDYNLPICKDATEDDVVTTCFQRDSAKDQAVVLLFIIVTVGLLGYAAVRPWVDKWTETARERRNYIPVSSRSDQ